IVAFLGTQDPRERPADKQQQADAAHVEFTDPQSDFVGVLNLWNAYRTAHEELTQSKLRDWCAKHFVSFMRMREWRELHRQLLLDRAEGVAQRPQTSRLSSVSNAKTTDSGSPLRGVRNDEQDVPAHDLHRDIHLALLSG